MPTQRGINYCPRDKVVDLGPDNNSVLSPSSNSNSFLHVPPNTARNHIDSRGLGGEGFNVDLITETNDGTSSLTVTSTTNEFTKEKMLIAEDTIMNLSKVFTPSLNTSNKWEYSGTRSV